MNGWMPISTAPRDHLPRLVWSKAGGMRRAFLDVTWTWWPIPARAPLKYKPTHWMECPPPPEEPKA